MRQQRIADARAAEKSQKDPALAQQKENARLAQAAQQVSSSGVINTIEDFFLQYGSGTLSVKGGFIFVGELQVTINTDLSISTYIGVGLGAGWISTVTANLGGNIVDANGRTQQEGFTANASVGGGAGASLSLSGQAGSGGVTGNLSGGYGYGAYAGNTFGYTMNFNSPLR